MPNKHEEFVLGGTDKLENYQKELEKLQKKREEYEKDGKEVPDKLEKDIKNLDEKIEEMMEEAMKQAEEEQEGKPNEELSPEDREAIMNILKEEEEKTRRKED